MRGAQIYLGTPQEIVLGAPIYLSTCLNYFFHTFKFILKLNSFKCILKCSKIILCNQNCFMRGAQIYLCTPQKTVLCDRHPSEIVPSDRHP